MQRLDPIFRTIAPGIEAAERTPGRTGDPVQPEFGYLHCGPPGAGHFVKMVHNGIEYGIMAAYAEGMGILRHANVGKSEQVHDAETTPLRDPQFYQYEIDTAAVAEVWRRGSVISSWLLDLTAIALNEDPNLDAFGGRVSDSGEGRWTILAAVDEGVPAHVLTAALFERFSSRGEALFGDKLLSAMRKQFGGHDEKKSMSVVRINAITVPAERAEEFERRFAARAGEVATMDGFEAFELLRPTDDRGVYLVYTRWASPGGLRRLGLRPGLPAGAQGAQHRGAGVERELFVVLRRDPVGGAEDGLTQRQQGRSEL